MNKAAIVRDDATFAQFDFMNMIKKGLQKRLYCANQVSCIIKTGSFLVIASRVLASVHPILFENANIICSPEDF